MQIVLAVNRNQITPRSIDYEEVSVGAAAIGLTAAKVAACWWAMVKCEGASCRFRKDGVDPSATVGYPLFDGEQVEMTREEAALFKAFRVGGSNPTLRVDYLAA